MKLLLIEGRNPTLLEAKDWLRGRLDDGEKCPCCTQLAKIYRRKINSGMAAALMHQYRLLGVDYGHTTKLCAQYTHEAAQLSWWGLLAGMPERREDGGRQGWWRVTGLGISFIAGNVRVAKYAKVFDGRLLGLDDTESVSIYDCLGTRFDYSDLMGGR